MELYEEFKGLRDRFEILAFHDSSVDNFEELDRKLAPTVVDVWKGKVLPFPVLLDASGETIAGWGVNSFPTVVLIDPEGRVVRNGDETTLAEKLRKEQK